jgi:hypothetical protein
VILITKNNAVSTEVAPSVYVEDVVYTRLPSSEKLREAILDAVKETSLVVGRLGKNVSKDAYTRESAITLDSDVLEEEVGLYLEL